MDAWRRIATERRESLEAERAKRLKRDTFWIVLVPTAVGVIALVAVALWGLVR